MVEPEKLQMAIKYGACELHTEKARLHARKHMHTPMRLGTHACAHNHARVHLRKRAHTHTRARTHTHTHTHTQNIQGGSNMTGTNCDLFTHK